MESIVAEANANATVVTALTERSTVFSFAWIRDRNFTSLAGGVRWAFAEIARVVECFASTVVHAWIVIASRELFALGSSESIGALADESAFAFVAAGASVLTGISDVATALFAFDQFVDHFAEGAGLNTTVACIERCCQRLDAFADATDTGSLFAQGSCKLSCAILTGPAISALAEMQIVHNAACTVVLADGHCAVSLVAWTEWASVILSWVSSCPIVTLAVDGDHGVGRFHAFGIQTSDVRIATFGQCFVADNASKTSIAPTDESGESLTSTSSSVAARNGRAGIHVGGRAQGEDVGGDQDISVGKFTVASQARLIFGAR